MSALQFLSGLCSCISQEAISPPQHPKRFFSLQSSKLLSALPLSVAGVLSDHTHTQTHAYMQLFIVPLRSGRGQVNRKKSELCVSQLCIMTVFHQALRNIMWWRKAAICPHMLPLPHFDGDLLYCPQLIFICAPMHAWRLHTVCSCMLNITHTGLISSSGCNLC